MNSPLIIPPEALARLDELCELRARPPVIRALIPQLPEAFVFDRWEKHTGRRPPRGPLPHTMKQFLASSSKRLEASYVIAQFHRLQERGVPDVDALIQVYRSYLEVFLRADEFAPGTFGTDVPLSFDRAWCLVRGFTLHNTLFLAKCSHCNTLYAFSPDEVPTMRLCPVRATTRVLDQASGAQKREKATEAELNRLHTIIKPSVQRHAARPN